MRSAMVFRCPSSSGLSLVVGLCLLWLSFSVNESASYSLRRRFGSDYYGNGRLGTGDWHRGLDHFAFPSSSSAGQQRLEEDDSSSSSSNPGVLFYAAPKFLQQMGRGMENSQAPSSAAAAASGGVVEDRMRKSSILRPTDREIQQFRENSGWSIPMSSVAKRNLCCSLDMYCVDCSDRK